ncbi:MAG: 50S ribosomal protein L30 [Clostridia bacterium]|nr:50S ribosomal protein L30 [Clostridia bacterium]
MAEVKEEVKVVAPETETAEVKKAPRKKAAPKAEGEATAKKTTKKAVAEAPVVEAVEEVAPQAEVEATVEAPVVEAKKEYPQPLIINGKYVAEKEFAKQYEKGDKPYELSEKLIKVTLVKSTAGSLVEHQRTVKALGLKKIRSFKIHNDNAAIRGMIFKVKHLVTVEEVK